MRTYIFIALLLCLPIQARAYCTLGADGNYYSDEDLFIDAANLDFRLKPGSCPVDKGVTLPEVQVDFDGRLRPQGKAPDIGAYELRQIEAPDGLTVQDE